MGNNEAFETKQDQAQSENQAQRPLNGPQPSHEQKPIYKKWWLWATIAVVAIGVILAIVLTNNQGSKKDEKNNLGDYNIVISSCRIAKYDDEQWVAIVKFEFTNNSDEATSFNNEISHRAYQNGLQIYEPFFTSDIEGYSDRNQTRYIQPGTTLEVEVAYVLDDLSSSIMVEATEYVLFSDKNEKKPKVTHTFNFE